MNSIFTLTNIDLNNAATNGCYGLGLTVGTGIITIAVDIGLHYALNIEHDGSLQSKTIRILAITAGLAPAVYFAPQIVLVSLTARKVAELFVICLVLQFAPVVNIFTNSVFSVTLLTSLIGSYPTVIVVSTYKALFTSVKCQQFYDESQSVATT